MVDDVCGGPGMQVCWQVPSIQHDVYANANQIPAEVDKRDHERGEYRHPAVYDLREEMGPPHQLREAGRTASDREEEECNGTDAAP